MKAHCLSKTIFLFGLVIFAALLLRSAPSKGQVLDLDNVKQIPTYLGALDADSFVALTSVHEEVPMNDKTMSYQVRLPKAWEKSVEVSTGQMRNMSNRVLGEIVRYYSPSDFYTVSRFTMTATELDSSITARNWFLNYVMTNGYVLQGLKVYSDREVEALYVLVEKDTSYSVRTKAIINGSRMFLVSYFAPYKNWANDAQERAMQERVVQSFRFLSPEEARVDNLEVYSYLDLIKFAYPATWRLSAPSLNSVQGMEARLVNTVEKKVLEGQINIQIVSTDAETSIGQEISTWKDKLKAMGFKLTAMTEGHDKADYEISDFIYHSQFEGFKAEGLRDNIIEHEFRMAVLVEDEYYYIVTLLTPNRRDSFYAWAINVEAYRTVLESIGPVSGKLPEGELVRNSQEPEDLSLSP